MNCYRDYINNVEICTYLRPMTGQRLLRLRIGLLLSDLVRANDSVDCRERFRETTCYVWDKLGFGFVDQSLSITESMGWKRSFSCLSIGNLSEVLCASDDCRSVYTNKTMLGEVLELENKMCSKSVYGRKLIHHRNAMFC